LREERKEKSEEKLSKPNCQLVLDFEKEGAASIVREAK
jgi:hypothetical protein